jgi:Right handed beta helix region
MNRFVALAVVVLLLTLSPSWSATFSVHPDGTGDYPTIQDAIIAAADGDSIVLASGRFTGPGNRGIDTQGKAVVITSRDGPDGTVIDAELESWVFHIHQGETNTTVISNIKILNGYATTTFGAGIHCDGASPLLADLVFGPNDYLGLAISNGNVDVVRCRFSGDRPPTYQFPGRSALIVNQSAVRLIDCHISSFHNAAVRASNADVVMTGNTIENNGQFDVNGVVLFENCTVSVLGNVIRHNGGSTHTGLAFWQCTGEVRGNWIEGNGAIQSQAGVEWEESSGDVSFNLLRENSDGGIQFSRSSGSILRNLIMRTQGGCCSSGTAIRAYGCETIHIENNTLYRNGNNYDVYHPNSSAAEIVFQLPFPSPVNRNVIVGKSKYAWIACQYDPTGCTTALAVDTVYVDDARNLVFGDGQGLYETLATLCIERPEYFDPLFRSEADDNFFLRPGSWAVVDTIIGNYHIKRSWGALPKGTGPSAVLDVLSPPDHSPVGASPGDRYPLTGFSINNTSTMDAVVNYRLVVYGATLNDNGDPLSLVGTTPILASGETFVPPHAALIVPSGAATVRIAYCYAYAPALNLVDTVTTTLYFEQPLTVRVTSFDATFEEAGVRLRWVAVTDGLEGWHIYRSINEGPWRRMTPTTIAAKARDYLDSDAHVGERYRYQLVAVQGGESVVGQIEVAPRVALTLENTPNPFNPSTTIRFAIPSATGVRLEIFGVDGSHVRTVLAEKLVGGVYNRAWDGRDDEGKVVSSGVYFCRLAAGKQQLTRKMVLAR